MLKNAGDRVLIRLITHRHLDRFRQTSDSQTAEIKNDMRKATYQSEGWNY